MNKKNKYKMECESGYYESDSYLKLGWDIFTHRLWHLYKHKKWID